MRALRGTPITITESLPNPNSLLNTYAPKFDKRVFMRPNSFHNTYSAPQGKRGAGLRPNSLLNAYGKRGLSLRPNRFKLLTFL